MAEGPSDAELLVALSQDESAFEAFYGRYFGNSSRERRRTWLCSSRPFPKASPSSSRPASSPASAPATLP